MIIRPDDAAGEIPVAFVALRDAFSVRWMQSRNLNYETEEL